MGSLEELTPNPIGFQIDYCTVQTRCFTEPPRTFWRMVASVN
jgi:hypothetical protein